MEEAIDWARGSGVTKLELMSFPTTSPRSPSTKLGFEEEGIRRRQYRIEGRYVDAILMALYLD